MRLSENEVADGIVFMNSARNMMYANFYSDELETEGEYKGNRKFDEDLQFVVMWSNNIIDLIDGKVRSVPVKKRGKDEKEIQGYLSANKNRTLLYMSFFGNDVVEEGQYKGRRKFDPELSFIIRWSSDVRDMIDGKVKSLKIYKKKASKN